MSLQGRYRVLERIRSSAHATLYRVYDEEAGEQLALKVLNRQHADSSIVKVGLVRGVRNDARVIEAPWGRYALAVMTKGCADVRYYPNNLGAQIVSKVSKALFDHFRVRLG